MSNKRCYTYVLRSWFFNSCNDKKYKIKYKNMKEFITTGEVYIFLAILYFIIAVCCVFTGSILLCIFAVLMSINTVLMYRREKRKNKK
nr:MAG TPA: Rifin [Bacteriophage sp.]